MAFRNPLRERLQAKEPACGLWVTLESPSVTEIAAELGLDWICIDTEHGHLDYDEVMGHLRAAQGTGLAALVRLPEIRHDLVKRALDMGAHGVFLPLVRSAADVEAGFRFGRYPPRGQRGIGGERAVRWGLELQEYVAVADRETLILPIIETPEAVQDIDAILAVPGLEAIWFGPADLSAGSGYVGEWEGPGVGAMIEDVRRRAEARGIASGVVALNPQDAAARAEQGFRMIGLGSDAGLMIQGAKNVLAAARKGLRA
jgi:2-keto-3-deoxy-L-rhamnonate aldolase RhmA